MCAAPGSGKSVPLPDPELPRGIAKRIKRRVLAGTRSAGGFALARTSRWRQGKLLVLAYHGISLQDEHHWNSSLFMSLERFRRRLEILRQGNYAVLPLDEALQRAASGDLPPASVAITFDDGLYCFYQTALPVLESFGYPATLYLTTFYSEVQEPVFDVAVQYLLWKSRSATLNLEGITGDQISFQLADSAPRAAAWLRLRTFARHNHFSAIDKQGMLQRVAAELHFDVERMRRERLFHLITPQEMADASRRGIDIQLHTHRHRVPLDRDLFLREIDDNRERIERVTGKPARHFCYPTGVHNPAFFPWLKERGVVSATTCEAGLTERATAPLIVPRLVDVAALDDIEFEAWLCGVSSMLPRQSSFR
jgi:peptidoglycan/xylan/chitin deacetylase (PgdA/CDA1 family)